MTFKSLSWLEGNCFPCWQLARCMFGSPGAEGRPAGAQPPRGQVAVIPVLQLGPLRPGKGAKFTAVVVVAIPGCRVASICWDRAGSPGQGNESPHPPRDGCRPPNPQGLRVLVW